MHRTTDEKGTKVNDTKRSAKTPSLWTGVLATLRALFHGRGRGACSRTSLALSLVAPALALALSATPAAAAPAAIFAGGGSGAGQVGSPFGVAVDQSTGVVYVADAENQRVDEFDSSGRFILAFGWGVLNGAAELQTCTIMCEAGSRGGGAGQLLEPNSVAVDQASHDIYVGSAAIHHIQKFSPSGEFILELNGGGFASRSEDGLPLAVDSSGNVWVGDVNQIEKFDSSGVFQSQVSVPGLGEVSSLAVDSSGDFYVISSNVAGVSKLTPAGETIYTVDESGRPTTLTLDGSGHLMVGEGYFREFDAATGAQTEVFGTGEVLGQPRGNALAFGDTAKALYVVSCTGGPSVVQIFTPPAPGPLVQFGSAKATAIHQTTATLNATVNPEGKAATTHFQYIAEKRFKEDGETFGGGTVATPESGPVGEDFGEYPTAAAVTGLKFETTYRFRVVATNSDGIATGEEATFTTLLPLRIDSTSASDITATSATLDSLVNPLGEAATYHFEYLAEAAYLANGGSFSGSQPAVSVPQPNAGLGSGEADAEASQHVQGLSPNTVYRYRVVAFNSVVPGGILGPTLAFTTQRTGSPLVLPDGRVWELVSPPGKLGADILPISTPAPGTQAAAAGGGMAYVTSAPIEAVPAGNTNVSQALSTRGPNGWGSRDIAIAHIEGTGFSDTVEEDKFLSEDLSHAIVQPIGVFDPAVSGEASEQTAYLRGDYLNGEPGDLCTVSCFRPLVTGAPGFENVPLGTEFGVNPVNGNPCPHEVLCGPQVLGATPDLSHIVLYSTTRLTSAPGDNGGLYEWSGGRLEVVSVLPSGGSTSGAGLGQGLASVNDVFIEPLVTRHAISADGSRVYFTGGGLYVREGVGTPQARTVPVPGGEFETASADGSIVFTLGGGQLSEFDLGTEVSTPLATGVLGVIGASEDGSSVYFVSSAVLTGEEQNGQGEKAVAGQPNLYLHHAGSTSFIATLSGEDSPDWGQGAGGQKSALLDMTARVSPDGGWLAFMSQRSLTGYDNRDAVSGVPDQEVYLYHAPAGPGAGALVCASCNPDGARPHGVEYRRLAERRSLVGGGYDKWKRPQWLAANVPTWTSFDYQSRYLSDGGRLFFNSADALVAQDTNGTEDVYEYEPPGVGGCTRESATFGAAAGGCVGLISSGASPEESAFLDASESGGDVFFLTAAKLSSRDVDAAVDVYDAHACSAASPCPPLPPPPAPACEGDACQSPVAAPEDPTPGSLTYRGPGNPVAPVSTTPAGKPKPRAVRCRSGFRRDAKRNKCVKAKRKTRARKAGDKRRAKP